MQVLRQGRRRARRQSHYGADRRQAELHNFILYVFLDWSLQEAAAGAHKVQLLARATVGLQLVLLLEFSGEYIWPEQVRECACSNHLVTHTWTWS